MLRQRRSGRSRRAPRRQALTSSAPGLCLRLRWFGLFGDRAHGVERGASLRYQPCSGPHIFQSTRQAPCGVLRRRASQASNGLLDGGYCAGDLSQWFGPNAGGQGRGGHQLLVERRCLLLEFYPEVQQASVVVEGLVGVQSDEGISEATVEPGLGSLRSSPRRRRVSRYSCDQLAVSLERLGVSQRDDPGDRNRSYRRHDYQTEQSHENERHGQVPLEDLDAEYSTNTMMITMTAATMAAAILTLLHGRWPWTSPVTPLMNTWNGFCS